jgi:cbb3-type cytochrome oxidase subunit 3
VSLKVSTTTTIRVTYVTQYFLTVHSDIGNPVGQGWYDAASTAHYRVLSEYADGISNYVFTTWTGQGAGAYTGDGNIQTVVMNNPITETANWEQQTNLYNVAESFLIILLLLLLLALLLLAWRRRKKKKEEPTQTAPENQTQTKSLQYPNFFS